MTDHETNPAGTAARITELEAQNEELGNFLAAYMAEAFTSGRTATELREAITRANAATAAAYEVAAQEMEDERASAAIRAIPTPDQTAALDKLIAEAEARAYQQASDTTWREAADIVLLQLLHDATCGEPVYMHNKRCYNAILAASKKGGV